jgi:16S rRNA (guanine527-N7)-methyltransferase
MTALDGDASLAGQTVSRETLQRLTVFADLLGRWTTRINLVSPASLVDLWPRHIADSAQLYPLAPPDFRLWADLGSGGGLPGLVIAALAAEANPQGRIVLVESDQRKAVFLQTAVREMGLAAEVIANRAEAVPPLQADIVSARALAPLDHLMPLAARHLAPDGVALFPKGRQADAELARARLEWHFDLATHPSRIDSGARILAIRNPRHV